MNVPTTVKMYIRNGLLYVQLSQPVNDGDPKSGARYVQSKCFDVESMVLYKGRFGFTLDPALCNEGGGEWKVDR